MIDIIVKVHKLFFWFHVFLHVMPKYSSAKQLKIQQKGCFISAKAWDLYRVRCCREGWVLEVFHEQYQALSHNPRPCEQTSCGAPSQIQFRQRTLHFQLREPVQGSSNWWQTQIWKLSLRQWAFGGISLDFLPIPANKHCGKANYRWPHKAKAQIHAPMQVSEQNRMFWQRDHRRLIISRGIKLCPNMKGKWSIL